MVRCDEDGAEMLSTRDIADLYDWHMRDGDEVTRARLDNPRSETVFK